MDTSVSEFMNTLINKAVRTPMPRTRPARAANSADSAEGRPNSFTRVAPPALKRSVIWSFIDALRSEASRRSRASRLPTYRAGNRKIGSRRTDSTVICQLMPAITARVRTSCTRLDTTPERVSEKARWAPMTSLLRRLTRAPVRVRMKNATGIVCTWSNTARRRSRIKPSPIRADHSRVNTAATASTTPIAAMRTASPTTT